MNRNNKVVEQRFKTAAKNLVAASDAVYYAWEELMDYEKKKIELPENLKATILESTEDFYMSEQLLTDILKNVFEANGMKLQQSDRLNNNAAA